MTKPAQHHKTTKKVKKSVYARGFFQSPVFHGLMAMLPVVAALIIVGLETGTVKTVAERELFLKLGKTPDSPALLYTLAKEAVNKGDLETGRKLYALAEGKEKGSSVLGASTDLEDQLWPEKKWQREWKIVEPLLSQEKSARVLLRAAKIKFELGEKEEAVQYWQKAWNLDPNDPETAKIGERLGVLEK